MLRTILFFPAVGIPLVVSLLFTIKINYLNKKGETKKADILTYKISSWWAKVVMKCAGAKINVKGLENIPKDKTVLVMANHQSYFDITLLMSELKFPKGFIAKKELESWFGVSVWMKKMHCVFMDRANIRKSAESIVEGINLLKKGHSMVIFPEGTRSKGGPCHEFKAGSFKLATKSNVLLVPVTIDGTYNLREANEKKRIKGASVDLIIHKPINVTTLSKEEIAELPKKVEKIITGSINPNRSRF